MSNDKVKEERTGKSISEIVKDHKSKLEKIIEIMETLDSETKLKIILFLYIYGELSLGKLSLKLDKSKATISRHIKSLISMDIVNVRKEKVRSPLKKHYYSMSPYFLDQLIIKRPQVESLDSDELNELLIKELKMDSLFLILIQSIIDQVMPYQENLQNSIKQFGISNFDKNEDFYYKNRLRYMLWPLNKDQYEEFSKKESELMDEMRERIREDQLETKNGESQENPYLIMHLMIPIKKIIEMRP